MEITQNKTKNIYYVSRIEGDRNQLFKPLKKDQFLNVLGVKLTELTAAIVFER